MFSYFYKSAVLFLAIFLLSACVSTELSVEQLNKQQAAKARVDVALGYLAQQNMPQAKMNLDKALGHAPDYYLVHLAMAYFYQQQGQTQQAQQAYLTAIQLDPQQGDSHNNYGVFLCSQRLFTQAYSQFEQALTSNNYYNQADTYENLVLCNLAHNDQTNLQKNLQQLRLIDNDRAIKLEKLINH